MIKKKIKNGKVTFIIQLNVTDKDGKRYQPKYSKDLDGNPITSKAKAEKLEREYQYQLRKKLEKSYGHLSFSEWHEKYIQQIRLSLRHSTVMQYDGDLKKWLPVWLLKKNLADITKGDIHQFIHEDIPTMNGSLHTSKRVLKSLRVILEAALKEGHVSVNPANGLTVKVPITKQAVLSTSEASKLLSEAKCVNHPFYSLWAFALLSGMRSGELYALRWSDINLEKRIITLTASWTNKNGYSSTKSNEYRVVPISPDLFSLLMELRSKKPQKEKLKGLNGTMVELSDLVLPRLNEWRFGNQAQVTKLFCKQIGITPVKFHDLRATFITNLLSEGVSTAKVMSIVGHSKLSTTDVYLRLSGLQTQGATDSLSYRLPTLNYAN